MRTAWEKTVRQGIVQFNDGKPEFVPGKKLLPMAGANVFDPERVREHRQKVKMALGSCLKTAKIVCKFVELPCFHCPAYVLTRTSALLAAPPEALALFPGLAHWPPERRNTIRYTFFHPAAKELFANWDHAAETTAAHLRSLAATR